MGRGREGRDPDHELAGRHGPRHRGRQGVSVDGWQLEVPPVILAQNPGLGHGAQALQKLHGHRQPPLTTTLAS